MAVSEQLHFNVAPTVALDDVSVTEWRDIQNCLTRITNIGLHSMTSVLLNGGHPPPAHPP